MIGMITTFSNKEIELFRLLSKLAPVQLIGPNDHNYSQDAVFIYKESGVSGSSPSLITANNGGLGYHLNSYRENVWFQHFMDFHLSNYISAGIPVFFLGGAMFDLLAYNKVKLSVSEYTDYTIWKSKSECSQAFNSLFNYTTHDYNVVCNTELYCFKPNLVGIKSHDVLVETDKSRVDGILFRESNCYGFNLLPSQMLAAILTVVYEILE